MENPVFSYSRNDFFSTALMWDFITFQQGAGKDFFSRFFNNLLFPFPHGLWKNGDLMLISRN